jgi:hypothetical protein
MARFFLLHACTRLGRYISLEERFVAWSAASGCGLTSDDLPRVECYQRVEVCLSVRRSQSLRPTYQPTQPATQLHIPPRPLELSKSPGRVPLCSSLHPNNTSLQPAVFCSGVLTALACILPSSSYTQRPFRLSVSSTPRKAALESSSA